MTPFAALAESLGAYVCADRSRLRAAVLGSDLRKLYSHAVRHKCAGLLFDALAVHRIRDPEIEPLRALLQRYAGACALESVEARRQVERIVRVLTASQVPHALLKSAAGLYAGDKVVERTHISDIDVLVPREHADRACRAMQADGYAYERPDLAAEYAHAHHHLAPLRSPSFKRPVELHVQLAPPGWFSVPSDWSSVREHFVTVEGAQGPTLRLDPFALALHYSLHGAYLRRLSDCVHVATVLRNQPALLSEILAATQAELLQRTGLQSVVSVAARMADFGEVCDPVVAQFVRWALYREDLPPALRDRAQLADAWFANGRRLRGPATSFARSGRAATVAARVLAGLIVMLRAPVLRER